MALTNDQKAERYNQLLRQHDRLEEKIADIKSEAAGMDLNTEQSSKVAEYKRQIQQVIAETHALFN
jgi:hypothetical protein